MMTPMRRRPAEFVTTRWELVLAATNKLDRSSQGENAKSALEELCSIYRRPIVEFCRNQLHRSEDAEDIAQAFLAEMIGGRFLSSAEKDKGRFRNLVLASLKNFVFDLHDRESAAKRGGKVRFVSLPDELPDGESMADRTELSADLLFDRAWAHALAHRALDKLRGRFSKPTQRESFDLLQPFLTSEAGGIEAQIAARKLGIALAAFQVRAHRFRADYAEILRQEVARTVSAPHEVEGELHYLMDVLIESQWPL
jgi:DNA-directed RNA polymerase specialized sigma24 family protein